MTSKEWNIFLRESIRLKMKRGLLGDMILTFEDIKNGCILAEAKVRAPWLLQKWELETFYNLFKWQTKNMM